LSQWGSAAANALNSPQIGRMTLAGLPPAKVILLPNFAHLDSGGALLAPCTSQIISFEMRTCVVSDHSREAMSYANRLKLLAVP
jgi:hypothetical protein